MKRGVLLINLGTPDAPDLVSVRRYLRQFLADSRVITLAAPLRYLLLYTSILPFKARKTARAYQSIWEDAGSPLLLNSQRLVAKLQKCLGDSCQVALGMRYGNPSISAALEELSACEHLTVLPLYPQYSSAASGSSLEKVLSLLATRNVIPSLKIIRDFYQQPGFIKAAAASIKPFADVHDYILFSYHGLPEQHLRDAGCQQICQETCPAISTSNQACYRAQCQETTRQIARALDLDEKNYGFSFQSRLGNTPWVKPYTEKKLTELARQGIKKLAICCPAFVADCVETLEEIGIRAKKQWENAGGEVFTLIPCINDSDCWVEELTGLLQN